MNKKIVNFIYVNILILFTICIIGCYAEKSIIAEIQDLQAPKFHQLIVVDNIFESYISIGDDENFVLSVIHKNGFKYNLIVNNSNIDADRVYRIRYIFDNALTPNQTFVVGKLYFKNKKLIFYRTAYINTNHERMADYY